MPDERRGELIVYRSDDGSTEVQPGRWHSLAQMAELFDATPQDITQHIGNVFNEREQDEASTRKEFLQVPRPAGD